MKSKITLFFIICGLIIYGFQTNWGFYAHKKINQMAVFTLPPEMMIFYKQHIGFLEDHAIDPDKRRYISKLEAFRHYIDLDHHGDFPFDNIPRNWTDALAMFTDINTINEFGDTIQLFGNDVMTLEDDLLYVYSEGATLYFNMDTVNLAWETYQDFFRENILPQYYQSYWKVEGVWLDSLWFNNGLQADIDKGFAEDQLTPYGIVPWHLSSMYYRLRSAFDTLDVERILRYSADFGHYIADAHVPLHTTQNYNGQLTNQVGIHAFWESRLPELFAEAEYDFFVGKADYIDDVGEYCWEIVLASHRLVDSVLLIEQSLRTQIPEDQQICLEERGASIIKTQCKEFSKTYHERMNGMVEDRMRGAIKSIGDLWYTAWVDAGQPDLRTISGVATIEETPDVELEKAFEKGKIQGRNHGN